jgi:hypothetical protein
MAEGIREKALLILKQMKKISSNVGYPKVQMTTAADVMLPER